MVTNNNGDAREIPSPLLYLFSVVELVALRRVAPRPAAQRLPANGAVRASRSAAVRGGVVAARQPLPLNRYPVRRERVRVRVVLSGCLSNWMRSKREKL